MRCVVCNVAHCSFFSSSFFFVVVVVPFSSLFLYVISLLQLRVCWFKCTHVFFCVLLCWVFLLCCFFLSMVCCVTVFHLSAFFSSLVFLFLFHFQTFDRYRSHAASSRSFGFEKNVPKVRARKAGRGRTLVQQTRKRIEMPYALRMPQQHRKEHPDSVKNRIKLVWVFQFKTNPIVASNHG